MINEIKKNLSSRIASVIVVLCAIIGRSIIQIHFASVGGDKGFQIQAAQNFLEGHGLTLLQVFHNDLSMPHFVPLVKWPPGYSFFLMPFLLLIKNDFFLASILLDIVTAILFILFSRRLLSKFQVPVYWLNIYTLVTGFFIYEFCTASTSDFLTLTIYIAALNFTLSIIQSPSIKPTSLFALAILLFLTGFTRFMFIPVAFVVPAYLIVKGYFNKNKLLLRKGVTVFLMLVFFMALFLFIQKSYTGDAAYITATEKGLYPQHLLRLYPFGLSAIININFICVQLAKLTGLSFTEAYELLAGIHFCLLAVLFFLIIQWGLKKHPETTLFDHYLYIGLLTSGIIVLLLVFLSVTNKLKTQDWSFVQEGRYFAFATFFIQQFMFLSVIRSASLLSKAKKIIAYSAFCILLFGTVHGIYFATRTITNKMYSDQTANNIKLMRFSDSLAQKLINENPDRRFVVSSQIAFITNDMAIKFKIPEFYDSAFLFKNELQTKQETTLILVRYLALKNPDTLRTKKIAESQDHYFYTVNLQPDEK